MSGANTVDLTGVFEGAENLLAEEVANLYMRWDSARAVAKNRWNETLQYKYATSTRETINGCVGGLEDISEDEGPEGWSHSTHIPKIAEISDNLSATYMSTVYPQDAFFEFVGEDSKSSDKDVRRTVESYLLTKHRSYKLRRIVQKLVDDYVDYGNVFAGVTYTNMETLPDNVGGPRIVGYKGPMIYRISPNDIVFNPLATSFEDSPKIIRSLKTMGELHRDVEENPALGYSQEALDKAREVRSTLRQVGSTDFDKHVQLQYDGFGSASMYFNSGFVEILEFYGDLYDVHEDKFYKNHVITVLDRKWVLRKEPLRTWNGRPLIYHAGWRQRKENLWAMGPLDNLIGMQYMINHLENARADAFDQMLEPTRVEVGDVRRIDAVSGKPGGVYRIETGEGSVTNLSPDTTVLNADNQISLKMQMMELFAGLPRQEAGFSTPGEKTLGEVQHLSRAASKLFRNKIITLEAFIEDLLKAELEIARSVNDLDDVAATIGEDGVTEFSTITKEDLNVNGRLVPVGSRHFDHKQQLVQNLTYLQQMLGQDQMALQHLSSFEIAKSYAELMELDKFKAVQRFVRVAEMAEMQKMQNAAQAQVETEDQVSLEDAEVTEEDGLETAVVAGRG